MKSGSSAIDKQNPTAYEQLKYRKIDEYYQVERRIYFKFSHKIIQIQKNHIALPLAYIGSTNVIHSTENFTSELNLISFSLRKYFYRRLQSHLLNVTDIILLCMV